LPVESFPVGIAVDPAGENVYGADSGSNDISVINTSTDNVTDTITLGGSPNGVAVNPAGTELYVTETTHGFLDVIDIPSYQIRYELSLAETTKSNPQGVAVNREGSKIYVASFGTGSIDVFDVVNNTFVYQTADISVGPGGPQGVAVSPDGSKVYATNPYAPFGNGSLYVIDANTNSIIGQVPVGLNPYGVSVNPIGTKIYVANSVSNTVSVVDAITNKVTTTIGPSGYNFGISGPFAFGQFIIQKLLPWQWLDLTRATVTEFALPNGENNSLISKLETASESLIKGNTGAAIGQIKAFINNVEAYEKSGKLTGEQARLLKFGANEAIKEISALPTHIPLKHRQ
jgi:YVTN family beta-propeller protein